MKRNILRLIPLALVAMLFSSCQTYGPNANRNAVLGGLLGAGVGAAIGEHKGRELEGAAIGGALGALAGTAVGEAQDQHYGTRPRSVAYPTHSRPVHHHGGYYPAYYPRTHVVIGGHYGGSYSRYGHYGRGYHGPRHGGYCW